MGERSTSAMRGGRERVHTGLKDREQGGRRHNTHGDRLRGSRARPIANNQGGGNMDNRGGIKGMGKYGIKRGIMGKPAMTIVNGGGVRC